MQLVQKPAIPEAGQAAADSPDAAGAAATSPPTEAAELAGHPSSSDAASAMEGVVEQKSHGQEGSPMGDGVALKVTELKMS